MRWEDERQSDNVEDRRGQGGGFGGVGMRRGGLGIGAILLALVGGWLLGINPLEILGLIGGVDGGPAVQQAPAPSAPGRHGASPADPEGRFVSTVLASTEDAWTEVFRQGGARYRPPKLVMFTGATRTACGLGQSAVGPFYCPEDQTVYIDLGFYQMLRQRFKAPGDFAQAYVVAHEVGHHVQNLLGTMDKVQSQRQRMSERQYNRLSVRLELQADCYAGIWARQSQQAKGWLEEGDVEEGLNAASQIGDDTMQKREQGTVVPDAFTHGSSEQRVHWFRVGMESSRLSDCDTFARTEP
jgi:predicted metalloprotease